MVDKRKAVGSLGLAVSPVKLVKRRGPYRKRTDGSAETSVTLASSAIATSAEPPPSSVSSSPGLPDGTEPRAPKKRKTKGKSSSAWNPNVLHVGVGGGGSVQMEIRSRQPANTPNLPTSADAAMASEPEYSEGGFGLEPLGSPSPPPQPSPPPPTTRKRKTNRKREARKTGWARWADVVIPVVLDAFLGAERDRFEGNPLPPLPRTHTHSSSRENREINEVSLCQCGQTLMKSKEVTCVDFSCESVQNCHLLVNLIYLAAALPCIFTYCETCKPLHRAIVECGFFPSSSLYPTLAFSFDILEFHTHASPRHTIPVNATRHGLVHLLRLHGVTLNNKVSSCPPYVRSR